jgi:hypothetical protein
MGSSRLMDQARDALRLHHYSLRTEQSYLHWIKRYILFHRKRHPREMGAAEISRFLTFLAVEKNVAAATQNQALAAILLLYKKVLNMEPGWVEDVVRAKRPRWRCSATSFAPSIARENRRRESPDRARAGQFSRPASWMSASGFSEKRREKRTQEQMALATFAETKVARGCRGRSAPLIQALTIVQIPTKLNATPAIRSITFPLIHCDSRLPAATLMAVASTSAAAAPRNTVSLP